MCLESAEVEEGAVKLLVGVEVEDLKTVCVRDGIVCLESAEVEEGAVKLLVGVEVEDLKTVCVRDGIVSLESAEVEGGAAELLEDAEVENVAALQLEAFGLKTLKATRAFELALDSSGCSPDLDSAFSLEDSYSLPG